MVGGRGVGGGRGVRGGGRVGGMLLERKTRFDFIMLLNGGLGEVRRI